MPAGEDIWQKALPGGGVLSSGGRKRPIATMALAVPEALGDRHGKALLSLRSLFFLH